MKKAFLIGSLLLFLTIAPWFNAHADSFSCEGGIISTDDRSTDVMAKCGKPDFKNSHEEAVSQRIDHDTKQTIYITVEEWTYNLGPNQFTRIIILKNGRVTEIQTGSYGYQKK